MSSIILSIVFVLMFIEEFNPEKSFFNKTR